MSKPVRDQGPATQLLAITIALYVGECTVPKGTVMPPEREPVWVYLHHNITHNSSPFRDALPPVAQKVSHEDPTLRSLVHAIWALSASVLLLVPLLIAGYLGMLTGH